jgi:hypothetical protein
MGNMRSDKRIRSKTNNVRKKEKYSNTVVVVVTIIRLKSDFEVMVCIELVMNPCAPECCLITALKLSHGS